MWKYIFRKNNEQHYIDCWNIDTCRKSLSKVTGVSIQELRERLDNAARKPLGLYENPENRFSPESVGLTFDEKRICWYHGSRVWDINDLRQGILPLNVVVNEIKTRVDTLIRTCGGDFCVDEVISKHRDHRSISLFYEKVTNPGHHGPYGLLIGSALLCAKQVSNHDYLETPEIIEDLFVCIKDRYQLDLFEKYRQETRPIIVGFVSDNYHNVMKTVFRFAYDENIGDNISTINKGPVSFDSIISMQVNER